MSAKQTGYFSALKLLHTSLFIGMIVFAGITTFLVTSGRYSPRVDEDTDRILQAIAVSITAVVLIIGYRIFKRRLTALSSSAQEAGEKLQQYRKAAIIWWAMIEFPGFAAMICFLLSGNYAFLALAGFHIMLLGLFSPRKENIALLLKLHGNDVEKMDELL